MKDTGHLKLEPVVDVLSFPQPHISLNESQSHSMGGFSEENVLKIYFKSLQRASVFPIFLFPQSESVKDLQKLYFLLSSAEREAK